jgi:hypothetical protein
MHLPSLLVALGVCSAWAAPLEQQQPLAGSGRKHAGPHKVKNPYKPGYYDEWDRKIDSQGDKLYPEPMVRLAYFMSIRVTNSLAAKRRRH